METYGWPQEQSTHTTETYVWPQEQSTHTMKTNGWPQELWASLAEGIGMGELAAWAWAELGQAVENVNFKGSARGFNRQKIKGHECLLESKSARGC